MHAPAAPERQADPAAVALAVALRHRVPAAVLAAQVLRHVGHVDELVGILMGVVEPADDDVGAAADIGRHGRLRPHVFPRLVVDLHLDAGRFGELRSVRHPLHLVALDEAAPAQHTQLGAGLDVEAEGVLGPGAVGQNEVRSEGAGGCQPGGAAE
jgi:hypothetical protein